MNFDIQKRILHIKRGAVKGEAQGESVGLLVGTRTTSTSDNITHCAPSSDAYVCLCVCVLMQRKTKSPGAEAVDAFRSHCCE